MIRDKIRWIWKWQGIFLGCLLLVSLPLVGGCDGSLDIEVDDGDDFDDDLEDVEDEIDDLFKKPDNSVLGKKWIVDLLKVSQGQ